jgi:chromosome partitioning protein
VKLIDMDPQHSACDWTLARDDQELPALFEVEAWPHANLHKHIKAKASGVDHVIIDVPPQTKALARSALASADLVLIPVQPSPLDIWAAGETVALLREVEIYRPELRYAFVLNNHDARSAIGREAMIALREFEGVPRLETVIRRRVAFPYALGEGKLIYEYAPTDKGTKEIRLLAREMMSFTAQEAV